MIEPSEHTSTAADPRSGPRSAAARAVDAILVITDAPTHGIDFGIDTITYETGTKFKGLSMVPRGMHLVYYSTGMGSRQGFFFNAVKGEVVVRPWDSRNEEICARNTLGEEAYKSLLQALARGELNANLGPYPTSQHHSWINLSNFISNKVLARADIPTDVLIFPGDDEDIMSIDKAMAGSQRGGAAIKDPGSSTALKPFFPDLARMPRFSDVLTADLKVKDRVARDENMLRELVSLSLDKSKALHALVKSYFDDSWDDLLGELQLSFVLMMFLYSYPAMEHWKLLVSTICSCESILVADTNFTTNFIRILYSQLKFVPEDFFENELSKENFLRSSLTSLFSYLNTRSISEELKEHRKRFLFFVRKRFGLFEISNGANGSAFVASDTTAAESTHPSSFGDGSDLMYNLIDEDMPVIVDENDLGGVERRFEEQLIVGRNAFANVYPPLQVAHPHASHWESVDSVLGIVVGGAGTPVPVMEEGGEENRHTATHASSAPLTPSQSEAALFSWRYPELYEEMCRQAGREDLVMTAVRLLDTPVADGDGSRHLYIEAKMYLEMEVSMQR